MATTSRRKKKESAPVIEEAKPAPKPEIIEEKDTLLPEHLLQLEVRSRDVERMKLYMSIEEQALRNLILERMLMDNKIDKLKTLLQEKAQEYSLEQQKFKTFKKELWPLYGLNEADGLGYDPITGKIVKQ